MITIALLICLIGLIGWLIFSKTSVSDPWAAEVGRIMFAMGLLAYLLNMGIKSLF